MDTTSIRTAPVNSSVFFCIREDNCGRFFSLEQGELLKQSVAVHCSGCGRQCSSAELAGVAVRAQEMHLFDDETALNTTWFHVSARPNWATDILEEAVYNPTHNRVGHSTLMVHLGSIEAAKDRARWLADSDPYAEGFFLYEVRLAEGTTMNPSLAEDEGESWPEVTAQCGTSARGKNYERFVVGANRYVNSFEAYGSVSVLVDAPSVQVISSVQVDPYSFMPV